ncbi:major facilitator superfamily domain-containing protein [Bisporella sp. PMI_857]|nr:major facilitator superfamily domain-containing protein [Bisporella sp. PMI_857]
MDSSTGINLDTLPNNQAETVNAQRPTIDQNQSYTVELSLPRADGGKDAWLFLISCFVVEALVWGFPFSFGVFQDYYSSHETFSSDASSIAAIGTTATGVMYLVGLLLFPAYKKWPHIANFSKWGGLPLIAIGLVAGSFATNITHLIMTQGILYAIGGSLVYCPTLVYLDEWFVMRKGLAFGVVWAGSGIAGLIVPFALSALLKSYGFRVTLRSWAALMLLCLPLVHFLRRRLPLSRVSEHPQYGLDFLKTSTFWLLQIGFIVESLGYFVPGVYLPSFARSLGLSSTIGTLLLALVNGSAVISTVIMGLLIDRLHVTTVILISTVGTTISVFAFWGLSTALPMLCVFSVLYGFFAGGFVSTNAGIIKIIKEANQGADVGMLLGLLSAARGIGVIASGPISQAMLNGMPWQNKAFLAYGSGYGGVIVFTGVTAAVGGISFLGKKLGWM